jgi:hypothetical protein
MQKAGLCCGLVRSYEEVSVEGWWKQRSGDEEVGATG